MKKSNSFWLLTVAALVGWASVETFRLWDATQQAAASQQLHLRTSTRLEAARAKNVQVAHSEAAQPANSAQK